MTQAELRPCPFCGAEAVLLQRGVLWRAATGCEHTELAAHPDAETVIKRWNTRHESAAMKAVVEALDKIVSNYQECPAAFACRQTTTTILIEEAIPALAAVKEEQDANPLQ